MNDNIAIITFDMIPNTKTWGGCQRMYYLAKEIHSQDKNVTVYSFDKLAKNTYGQEIPFKTKALKSKSHISNRIINLGSRMKSDGKDNQRGTVNFKYKLKRNIVMLTNVLKPIDDLIYNEPQLFKGMISTKWINEYFDYFCEEIISNKISTIIISAPPFGLLNITQKLKKRFNNSLYVIIDYRDPWNLWKKGSFISINKEKKALNSADVIVVTNEFHGIDLGKKFDISSSKIKVVSNGFSLEDWNKAKIISRSNESEFKISFVGAISLSPDKSYRDCTNLLEAFDKFRRTHRNVKLEFVGVSNPNSDYVNKLKARFKDSLSIYGHVSSVQAIEYMQDSDILLLIHTASDNSSKYLVSGKLYDYIRSGRAIFSVGDPLGIHHKLINENNLGVSVKDNVDEIYEGLVFLYKLWTNNSLDAINNIANLEEFSREYQNKKYYNIIRKRGDVN